MYGDLQDNKSGAAFLKLKLNLDQDRTHWELYKSYTAENPSSSTNKETVIGCIAAIIRLWGKSPAVPAKFYDSCNNKQ